MESDDGYQSLSPPGESSPPIQQRKLKRLKKKNGIPNGSAPRSVDDDDLLSIPRVDFAELEALEASGTLMLDDLEEPMQFQSPSPDFGFESELNSGFDGLRFDVDRSLDGKSTKRTLEFDDAADELEEKGKDETGGFEEESTEKTERLEKKRSNEGELSEKQEKKKKKRVKQVDDNAKPSNKRREEKERKAYLQQLHVESQRILRETRDATFKPVPVVHKPISSILENIRQRKLEVAKKSILVHNNYTVDENKGSSREVMMDLGTENVPNEMNEVEISAEAVEEKMSDCHVDMETGVDANPSNGSEVSLAQSSQENVPTEMTSEEKTTPSFRTPVDDTQDLFNDSQSSDSNDELANSQLDSPTEEVIAPSLLAMNLKFDSAPPDDASSDEEDNDKENMDPRSLKLDNGSSSPKGDPVKAFLDDEAEEEDDSDTDLCCFQENEEGEDNEDLEELNDMIATDYKERPIDKDRRNELHQKWLEQQDAAGTDNLLHRLKYCSKQRDTTLLDEEEQDNENEAEADISGEAAAVVPTNNARLNYKKAKQMIAQMFSDNDDAYLSEGDEETEKMILKQHLLVKAENQSTLLPPAEDESSREFFGLIKKLNIVPDAKKKPKASSIFDRLLVGGDSNSSSKSSFIGRVSNRPLPTSRKQGSSRVRAYIFGRDDSNSTSSLSMSEDSSSLDAMQVSVENPKPKNNANKFANLQSKFSSGRRKSGSETENGTSLFEILKRSSTQSNVCSQASGAGFTQTAFAAFKIPKKPMKMEGRS